MVHHLRAIPDVMSRRFCGRRGPGDRSFSLFQSNSEPKSIRSHETHRPPHPRSRGPHPWCLRQEEASLPDGRSRSRRLRQVIRRSSRQSRGRPSRLERWSECRARAADDTRGSRSAGVVRAPSLFRARFSGRHSIPRVRASLPSPRWGRGIHHQRSCRRRRCPAGRRGRDMGCPAPGTS